MEIARQFEQLEQVDDLVIAPIADVAPGVVGFLDLPVDTLLGDAVRVVAINSGCIDELGDHVFDEVGEAECKCLPILKDIPPVALVRQQALTGLVLEADLELVPGTTRIAVAPAKRDGQVFHRQAPQLCIPALIDKTHKFIET